MHPFRRRAICTGRKCKIPILFSALVALAAGCGSSGGSPDPNPYLLSTIESGAGGFAIYGADDDKFIGENVSGGGDVNGDGFDDLVLASSNSPGEAFVVFGKADTGPLVASDLDGAGRGFTITSGAPLGQLFRVAMLGDVNGDGLSDVPVAAPSAEVLGIQGAGIGGVIFGSTTPVSVDMADILAGVGGFAIAGTATYMLLGDGIAGLGDVNGDGLDDLGVTSMNGASYVIFGKTSTTPVNLADLDAGIGGFALRQFGSPTRAGDVNADGVSDILASMPDAGNSTGAAAVIFGGTSTAPVEVDDIAKGIGGFPIYGVENQELAGIRLSAAGDFNGDGFDDVLVSSGFLEFHCCVGAFSTRGGVHVVFGKATTAPVFLDDVRVGHGGVFITGSRDDDQLIGVAFAGDVNDDGLDDILVGASNEGHADRPAQGTAYLIYGTRTTVPIDVRDVAARRGGFCFWGSDNYARVAYSLSSAGDTNGDGVEDILIGSSGVGSFGRAHVVFLPPVDAP